MAASTETTLHLQARSLSGTHDSRSAAYRSAYRTLSRMSPADKQGYRDASINIHNVETVNDSTTIVNYSNSYKKEKADLKVVRLNGAWLVDFKHSFPADTTAQ